MNYAREHALSLRCLSTIERNNLFHCNHTSFGLIEQYIWCQLWDATSLRTFSLDWILENSYKLLRRALLKFHRWIISYKLMGIGETLNKKLEDANYYGLRTIMNMGKSTDYESILRMADMNTLEHRRIEQSLMIFFKCFKENGPGYVANLFKPRVTVTPYNLRSNGLNVVQSSYNSGFLHGSCCAYMISHIWNQLSPAVKNAPNGSSFRRLLSTLNFIGCQCSNCLWPDLLL